MAKHTIVNALTAATAEQLGTFLRSHSIKVKHVSEEEATRDKMAHQKAVENKSWIGRDCHVLLENIGAGRVGHWVYCPRTPSRCHPCSA